MASARARWPLSGAGVLFAASLALFRPGFAMYDTVVQYGQVLAGRYDDWHPPAMARMWALFGPHGAMPMLAIQLAGYWLGLGLLAAALAHTARRGAAAIVLTIGICPIFLGWQAAILKDAQMLAAMLVGVGLVAAWHLRQLPLPRPVAGLVAVAFAYAVLVRANAVFAVLPLAFALARRPRDPRLRCAAWVCATLLVLALAPVVNHRLLGASSSGVERTQALYDLSGIAVRTGDAAVTGIAPDAIGAMRDRRCVKAFFWDPLGDEDHCQPFVAPLYDALPHTLYVRLAGAILRHPLAYAAHRLAHWNATERWLVPARLMGGGPPDHSEASAIGLGTPGAPAKAWQRFAAELTETPLGWPIAWTMLAALLMPVALRAAGPAARLASALLVSALALEASFLVLSIASDLRYHLWPMVATALAAVLLAPERWWRRRGAMALLLLVVFAGTAVRIASPLPPQGYQAMVAS